MLIVDLVFWIFALMTVIGALTVITVRNPVHAVLALICTFFSTAALMLVLGAEFVAMITVIVYVGAVAVLFLFVVMMLDLDLKQLTRPSCAYSFVGILMALIFAFDLYFIITKSLDKKFVNIEAKLPISDKISNTKAIGEVFYTDYLYQFQAIGIILLVAIIGAITLTLRNRPNARHQNSARQIKREAKAELVKIEPGESIDGRT